MISRKAACARAAFILIDGLVAGDYGRKCRRPDFEHIAGLGYWNAMRAIGKPDSYIEFGTSSEPFGYTGSTSGDGETFREMMFSLIGKHSWVNWWGGLDSP
jgi:hypothetical protein